VAGGLYPCQSGQIYVIYTYIPYIHIYPAILHSCIQHSPNKKYTPDKLNSIYVVDAYYKYLYCALVSVVCNHGGLEARRMTQYSTLAAGIYSSICTQRHIIVQIINGKQTSTLHSVPMSSLNIFNCRSFLFYSILCLFKEKQVEMYLSNYQH
jgi:hypothetical protein